MTVSTKSGTSERTGANVKGTVMAQTVKYLRSRREAGRAVVPPHLAHYLETRVLATSWYPEEDYIELMRAVAEILPAPDDPTVSKYEYSSRITAGAHFEGPYKVMVRPGNPGATLRNLDALWRLRHDTGGVDVEIEGASARIVLDGYPVVSNEMCDLIQGSIWGIASYAGARDIVVRHPSCRARGDATCEWRATWKA